MHSPEVVAFDIRRPFPRVRRHQRREDRRFRLTSPFWQIGDYKLYWPPLITVWHNEPDGQDALRGQCRDTHWQWHVHHWTVQVHPVQHLRRWALTRCEWCRGRSTKRDRVNVSMQWHRDSGHWWQPERGLFHEECTGIYTAHQACLCRDGVYESELSGWGYGTCARCGKRREWRSDDTRDAPIDAARRILASIPEAQRDADKTKQVRALWADYRASKKEASQ